METYEGPLSDLKSSEADVLSSNVLWRGPIFALKEDELVLPGSSRPVKRQYLDHPGAVGIIALSDDRAPKVLLIEQYRHPSQIREWEVPAGLLDVAGEDYLNAAKRELREEADLQATEWNVLADFFTSPGNSNESLRIFLARGLQEVGEAFPREEEEATMRKTWRRLDEAARMVLAGVLHNPTASLGILAAYTAFNSGWEDLRPADASWLR